MRAGTVILSDIAASTLGIALFVLLVTYTSDSDAPPPTRSEPLQGEMASIFKAISARPQPARDMVSALYARTEALGADQVTIDVLQNRVEIRSRSQTARAGTQKLYLSDPNFQTAFRRQITQSTQQGQKVYLFVFSNRTLNLLHQTLTTTGEVANVLFVPAALRSASPQNPQGWDVSFLQLAQSATPRAEFETALRQFLLRAQNRTSNDQSTGAAPSNLGLLARLAWWWDAFIISVILLIPIWCIALIERRAVIQVVSESRDTVSDITVEPP